MPRSQAERTEEMDVGESYTSADRFCELRIGKGLHRSQDHGTRASVAIKRLRWKAGWEKWRAIFGIGEPDSYEFEVYILQPNCRRISCGLKGEGLQNDCP